MQPFLDDAYDEARADLLGRGPTEVEALVVNKVLDVADTVVDDFVSGIASRALTLLLVALAGIGLYIFWPLLFRPAPSEPAPEDEHNSS